MRTRVEVISADAELVRAVTAASRWRVHSAFRHAVNFRDEAGQIWTMGARQMVDGPHAARLDLDNLDELGLETGDPFDVSRVVNFDRSLSWMPAAAAMPDASAVRELERAIAALPAPEEGPFAKAAAFALAERRRAFADSPPAELINRATALVGLGTGLTPSGDDFLAGYAFVCAQLAPEHPALAAVAAAVDASATTDVSQLMIRNALLGRAAQPLHRLLSALSDRDGVHDAVLAVAAIGHHSGVDLLSGVLAALNGLTTKGTR